MVDCDIKLEASNEAGAALVKLQERTLHQILRVCPQPSMVLIKTIANQMDLPPKQIWNYFHQNEKSKVAKKLIL